MAKRLGTFPGAPAALRQGFTVIRPGREVIGAKPRLKRGGDLGKVAGQGRRHAGEAFVDRRVTGSECASTSARRAIRGKSSQRFRPRRVGPRHRP